jgi:hypothetical protein
MQNTDNVSIDSDQHASRWVKPRFTHPRVSCGNRHPISLVKRVLTEVQANPEKLDSEIAEKLQVRPGLPLGLRLLLTRRPDLLDRVISGELSLGMGCRLMRESPRPTAATTVPNLATAFAEPKLRADLLAWCTLTRELLDSIENTLTAGGPSAR